MTFFPRALNRKVLMRVCEDIFVNRISFDRFMPEDLQKQRYRPSDGCLLYNEYGLTCQQRAEKSARFGSLSCLLFGKLFLVHSLQLTILLHAEFNFSIHASQKVREK